MLARNETIFKWALYAGATAVFFLLQVRIAFQDAVYFFGYGL